jgi:hypothetical protein
VQRGLGFGHPAPEKSATDEKPQTSKGEACIAMPYFFVFLANILSDW